jgi:hypothetical protein
MTEAMLDKDTHPWYRYGWPWLLIALPASAVVGGILTLIIAVRSPNALVVDDYYKQGLAINQEKHRIELAESMQLKGLMRSDGRLINLRLESPNAEALSETLELNIVHATRSELDRTLRLQRGKDGGYQATLATAPLPAGNWYLRLQDPEHTWELRSRITSDGPFQTKLTAKD